MKRYVQEGIEAGKRILSSLTISEALAPENEWLLNPYEVGTIEHDWFSDGYKSYLKAKSKEQEILVDFYSPFTSNQIW